MEHRARAERGLSTWHSPPHVPSRARSGLPLPESLRSTWSEDVQKSLLNSGYLMYSIRFKVPLAINFRTTCNY